MQKIRVGILGTGSIVRRVMADFFNGDNYVLTAFASRSLERAKAMSARYGAPLAFGSYLEMAESSDVDLVYIASPHNYHKEHTCLMLSHGKHVICEKAFALNDREASEMIDLARKNHLFLMEAMWTRFMPANMDLKARINDLIGDIYACTANFGFNMPFDAENRIYNMFLAGGALMDVGIYPLSFAAYFLGTDVQKVTSSCVHSPTGSDARLAFQLSYRNGAFAQLHCAVDMVTESRAMLYGSKGYVEIPNFWHAEKYIVHRGDTSEVFSFPAEHEGHHHEFVHAADCILNGKTDSDVMPLSETLSILQILSNIRRENGIIYPEETEYVKA